MIKFLKHIFGLCNHKWTIIEKNNIYNEPIYAGLKPGYSHTEIILQCEHCGNIKTVRAR